MEKERRLRGLEDMIEQLSSTFMAFTDEVLDSRPARGSTPLLNNILQTMRVFHGIALEVVPSEAGDGLGFYSEEGSKSPSISSDDSIQHNTPTATTSQANNGGRSPRSSSEKVSRLTQRPSSPDVSRMPYQEFSSPHMQPQVLGNGWIYTPVPVLYTPMRMGDHILNIPEFCIRLVETTVATSYTLLLADAFINKESEGTFRWSRRYTTHEGLLYCMRWMLGPGRKLLPLAVNVPANLYARYLATGRKITFESGVSDTSNNDNDVEGPELPSLLNAADVFQKLMDLNCRFVDEDAIEITVRAGHSNRQQNWFLDRFPARQPAQESSTLTLRLSKALLISNLAYCSICLGQGPGYPMEDFARIVEASATSVSESGPLL